MSLPYPQTQLTSLWSSNPITHSGVCGESLDPSFTPLGWLLASSPLLLRALPTPSQVQYTLPNYCSGMRDIWGRPGGIGLAGEMWRELEGRMCGFGDSQTLAHPRQVGESSELERETAGVNGSRIGGLAPGLF